LSRPPKSELFAGNSRFRIQIVKTGQEMRPSGVAKRKKRKNSHQISSKSKHRRSYDVI